MYQLKNECKQESFKNELAQLEKEQAQDLSNQITGWMQASAMNEEYYFNQLAETNGVLS